MPGRRIARGSGSRPSRPLTIRDVARAAGVSVSTVSKALNGNGQLREETRKAVQRVAQRLRFRPNEIARSLSSPRCFTVGLISIDRKGRFSLQVLDGIEDTLDSAKISVFLCNTAGDPARERQHVESLLAKRVDGIIVTGDRAVARVPLDLDGESLPVIYAFARVDDPEGLCLLPDDRGGGRLVAEHLVGLGRRHFAHITGPADAEAVRHRREGFKSALAAHGIDLDGDTVLPGAWSEAWGHEAVDRLFSRRKAVDAIFCGSDQIARGVVDALRDRGIRVPDDVAIVGFDNWEIIATATRPPLTTVDMNLHELGRQAGLRLLARAGDGSTDDALIGKRAARAILRLPCRLVVRQSCGAPVPTKTAPDATVC